ncbi:MULTISPECIES: 4-hydroxy-tetrahydrodipicolinate reductase [Psychrobacter]|uniref:4-hydroxy-tetrahydrodipicolinate reductase n=1 Tax=Psychrobacter alimentarius TaxID=261164 RepID=A0ABM5ZUC3_9GAMM|nr:MULTISPECIES: 4-hydroxy-tetrahydrodipicolinate reductase [Psychrobacter]AMT95684.1 4-hydroxy-tetrahydrodipicolinate reductase [Psychrobacter alimentarius]QCB31877.1 4-hydroxy-tetrahydrodipicolinate reductase [Psychrobacter sp. PAMC27889]
MSQQTKEQAIKVGVIGAGGRMGRMLIEAVNDNPQTTLNAAIERQGSSLVGADAGEVAAIGHLNVQIVDDLQAVVDDIDVLIDFSLPDATEKNMQVCAEHNVAMVIGTTGFNEPQEQVLAKASEKIAIVYAGNYSTGVNLSLKLLEMAAKAFGTEADVEVIEAHHKHKIDAPSGTAYMMAEAVADARGQNLKDVAVYGREGQTGEREAGTIGIHAIRGGEIIGDHTVMFIADGEVVEITHRARARMTFAAGAVRAATWVIQQEVGQYNMQDVLGLNE